MATIECHELLSDQDHLRPSLRIAEARMSLITGAQNVIDQEAAKSQEIPLAVAHQATSRTPKDLKPDVMPVETTSAGATIDLLQKSTKQDDTETAIPEALHRTRVDHIAGHSHGQDHDQDRRATFFVYHVEVRQRDHDRRGGAGRSHIVDRHHHLPDLAKHYHRRSSHIGVIQTAEVRVTMARSLSKKRSRTGSHLDCLQQRQTK